jgi:hypothetical protein
MKTKKNYLLLVVSLIVWGQLGPAARAESEYIQALQRTQAGAQLVQDLKEKRPELWDQFKNLKDATDVASFPSKVGGDLIQTIPGFSPGIFSGTVEQADKLAQQIKARKAEQEQAINPDPPAPPPGPSPQEQAKQDMQNDANKFRDFQNLNSNLLAEQQKVLNELAAQLKNSPPGSPERAALEAQMAQQAGKVKHTRDAMTGWGNRADNLEDALAGRPLRHPPPKDPEPVDDTPPDLSGENTVTDDEGNVSIIDDEGNLVPVPGWIKGPGGNLIRDSMRGGPPGGAGDGTKTRPPRVKTPKPPKQARPARPARPAHPARPARPARPGHIRPGL